MSERYRLVFRGEVHEGQHPAVVKKRLGQVLKLDGERLEALFSGKAVTLKRDADTSTAAQYQALFKKSGARLRILPLDQSGDAPGATPAATTPGRSTGSLELLPPRSDLLRADERSTVEPVEVDVSHIRLQGAVFEVADESSVESPPAPDVSHLSVAEPGARLAPVSGDASPVVDLGDLTFEVAEVGATMDQRPRGVPPEVPDTSHLQIDRSDAQ